MKETSLKRLHTMWPQPGEDKTIETFKKSVVASGLGEEREGWKADHRGFLGQWNDSVWYYSGG